MILDRRALLAAPAAVLLALSLLASPSAAAQPQDATPAAQVSAQTTDPARSSNAGMRLANGGTNLCLAIYGAQKSAGALIVDWTCGGGSEQSWQWVGANLQSELNPSMCLDLFQSQPQPQTSVTIATCNRNSPTQQWRFTGTQLLLQNFGYLCLGVTSPMPIQGGLIAVDTCKGSQGQHWTPRY
jgi:hypothetical protein